MKERNKYLVSAGLAVAVEATVVVLIVLGAMSSNVIGALHTPGLYLLEILGGGEWHALLSVTILVLPVILQYFIVAMALIKLKDLWHSRLKTDDPARLWLVLRSLLWSVATIGIVIAFILSYQHNKIRQQAQILANQGRRIYVAIFDYNVSTSMWKEWPFPVRGKFSSSTDYFNYLVDHKEINLNNHTYFMPSSAHDADANQLSATFGVDHNVWAVTIADTSNHDYSASDAPFLISRNIGFGNPPSPYREGMTTLNMNGLIESDPLLRGRYGVIVTYRGTVRIFTKCEARQEMLNPSEHALPILTP